MSRHPFGGGAPDWAVSTADGVPVSAVGGAIVKAYSAFLGGTQYTDLSMDQEGTQVVSQIVASDGTDGLMLGQIPQFYGPDGVWEVWLSANNGPRVRAQALDTADLVQGALDSIADVQDTLDQAEADHASIGQASGIATLGADGKLTTAQRPPSVTALASLTDVDSTGLANRSILRYSSTATKWQTETDPVLYAVHKPTDPAQHIADNAYQGWGVTDVVAFATRTDPFGLMDANNIVTVPKTGFYRVTGFILMGNSAVMPQAYLMSNGSLGSNFVSKVSETVSGGVTFGSLIYFTAGDLFALGCWQHNLGGVRDLAQAAMAFEFAS